MKQRRASDKFKLSEGRRGLGSLSHGRLALPPRSAGRIVPDMSARELAFEICRTLRASGHQAFLVGGCVRDLLLGRELEDYDVATYAHPDRVRHLFPGS